MTDVIGVPNGYTFIRAINSGGFGSVVEMIENTSKEHYAGKMMQCITDKDKARIDREVNRLRKFVHPGIVKLKEVTSVGNTKVIVMELGVQSLADIVKDSTSRGVLVAREVVYRVMVDVSSALKVMHNHESGPTAHGDVKMENILLFPGGHFKLCDLGAAESEDVSSTRSVMSQQYVSPERMESETGRATCSSDVWSLGIVLHWLLFGEPPFKAQNAARLFREIGSFKVSMIGSDCGGEERALLMRMLDPNSETRVTSCQLCSFGVFRCLVNTPSGVWKLKDADEKELHSEKEKWRKIARDLQNKVKKAEKEQETFMQLERELKSVKEALAESNSTLPNDRVTFPKPEPDSTKLRAIQNKPSPVPTVSQALSFPPPPTKQDIDELSKIFAVEIELLDHTQWEVSGNVYKKAQNSETSLISIEFGAVVARMSLTIRKEPSNYFTVGLIASKLSNKALTDLFPYLRGGAGWNLEPFRQCASQNEKDTNEGSACSEGREGQRVVLEADGREGKRTLKLSQDGETQPVFFSNIPVPFRFAVCIYRENDAIEIESIEAVEEPLLVGGTIPVKMDN
ncbi:putative Protein kinase domain containing protein [Blattamonas nauphoetae]|uniref:Protein kinase domain-containing protein n=1 Tax=Blattamonas nauphoetae TaxID=2049346 RepID=A0ABQ9XGH5_9EUKA|nr:putative Protein kinase domain containing protein [Blattamonas nauphoetae]